MIATAVSTVGTGLLYTFEQGTSSRKWISYQIISGVGYGFAFQIPTIAVQAHAKLKDLPA